MAAWDFPAKLWKLIREVEDLFKVQGHTEAALDAINGWLRLLEDRMTRLEAARGQLVVEAKAAAGGAASAIAGAVISDIVTRVTRIEMRAEQAQRSLPPPPGG
jgi:hypothetical protein